MPERWRPASGVLGAVYAGRGRVCPGMSPCSRWLSEGATCRGSLRSVEDSRVVRATVAVGCKLDGWTRLLREAAHVLSLTMHVASRLWVHGVVSWLSGRAIHACACVREANAWCVRLYKPFIGVVQSGE